MQSPLSTDARYGFTRLSTKLLALRARKACNVAHPDTATPSNQAHSSHALATQGVAEHAARQRGTACTIRPGGALTYVQHERVPVVGGRAGAVHPRGRVSAVFRGRWLGHSKWRVLIGTLAAKDVYECLSGRSAGGPHRARTAGEPAVRLAFGHPSPAPPPVGPSASRELKPESI
jgi:hypothetical protein